MNNKITRAATAIRNSFADCPDWETLDYVGGAVIEFCTAFEMTDEEITKALIDAGGCSALEDEFIDHMIKRLSV